MYIFDIHSHILPGLDDGAKNEDESLKMIQIAYEQGIQKIMATPHYSRRYHHYQVEELWEMSWTLEQKAKEKKIVDQEFHIYPGQELFCSEEMMEKLRKGQVLTLAGSTYILVEFFPGTSYSSMYRSIREMTMLSYRPIIAHVERYPELREENGRIEELIGSGALLQMNYTSVAGSWYGKDTRWCRRMLQEEKIHFLGTDMHNTTSRKPEVREAVAWMGKHLDHDYVKSICCKNPERVLKDQRI